METNCKYCGKDIETVFNVHKAAPSIGIRNPYIDLDAVLGCDCYAGHPERWDELQTEIEEDIATNGFPDTRY